MKHIMFNDVPLVNEIQGICILPLSLNDHVQLEHFLIKTSLRVVEMF
jgi:hypothetical protein